MTKQVLNAFDRVVELALFDNDHITKVITSTETFYESHLLEDVLRRTSPGELAVDVGAHVGNHTLFMAAIAGLDVIAIEPSPASVELLKTNVAANRVSRQVEVIEAAAGAEEAYGRLVEDDPANTGMTRVELGDGDVEVTTVDKLVGRRLVSVLKIDVEGWEEEVLKGSVHVLKRDRPILYMEIIDARHERALRDLLADLDYRFAREFNVTPTRLFLPVDGALPTLYPPVLTELATEQMRVITQLMRSIERMERSISSAVMAVDAMVRRTDESLRRHDADSAEYQEQIMKTTRFFGELYKRTRSATTSSDATTTVIRELLESVDDLRRRLGAPSGDGQAVNGGSEPRTE